MDSREVCDASFIWNVEDFCPERFPTISGYVSPTCARHKVTVANDFISEACTGQIWGKNSITKRDVVMRRATNVSWADQSQTYISSNQSQTHLLAIEFSTMTKSHIQPMRVWAWLTWRHTRQGYALTQLPSSFDERETVSCVAVTVPTPTQSSVKLDRSIVLRVFGQGIAENNKIICAVRINLWKLTRMMHRCRPESIHLRPFGGWKHKQRWLSQLFVGQMVLDHAKDIFRRVSTRAKSTRKTFIQGHGWRQTWTQDDAMLQ